MTDLTRRRLIAASSALLMPAILPAPLRAGPVSDTVRPFRIAVPDAALDDLRRRTAETRWPDKETAADASQGAPLARLQALVRHWGTAYDWRATEARLNALPQVMTTIDGIDVHAIHVRSRHPGALPLVMTHGWPGSVIELLGTIGPLTDPTAHGGRAEDAFDVVLPSMPGYGFSGKPTTTGWNPERIGRAWAELMRRLGYDRYVAQGGDWGAPVSTAMARQAPAGLLGVHLNLPAAIPPEVASALATGGPAPAELSDAERAAFAELDGAVKRGDRAYFAMMTARPQTLGYAMADSPAGLAAWLLVHPGFARWQYGDDPAQTPTRDQVLDDFSLYWLTNSGASAARLYAENLGRSVTAAAAQRTREIALPVAVTVFPDESYRAPETWARRAYPNLTYFNEAPRGGHFAAWEQPELFTAELRAAFRPLR